jgi:hypothetical protein
MFVVSGASDIPVDSEACNFVNLEVLPVQSSKMLLEVEFVCVYLQG